MLLDKLLLRQECLLLFAVKRLVIVLQPCRVYMESFVGSVTLSIKIFLQQIQFVEIVTVCIVAYGYTDITIQCQFYVVNDFPERRCSVLMHSLAVVHILHSVNSDLQRTYFVGRQEVDKSLEVISVGYGSELEALVNALVDNILYDAEILFQ